jgi:hypothetical protein
MFDFTKSEFQRTVIALVGALVLSTACIGAAVGPARAAEVGKSVVTAPATPVNA